MRVDLSLLALASLLAAAPAGAEDLRGGAGCTYTARKAPKGDPKDYATVQTGGPVFVLRGDGMPASNVVVTCSIQLNSATPGTGEVTSVSSTPPATGVAYLTPTSVSFQAGASDSIYLCTKITWTGGEQYFDGDLMTAGAQCMDVTDFNMLPI